MYLSHWQFENYPPFAKRVEIEFEQTGLTFFVGANNSGKTRIAQSLTELKPGLADPHKTTVAYHFGNDVIERKTSDRLTCHDSILTGWVKHSTQQPHETGRACLTATAIPGLASKKFGSQFLTGTRTPEVSASGLLLIQGIGASQPTITDSLSKQFHDAVENRLAAMPPPFSLPASRSSSGPDKEVNATSVLLPDGSNLADVCLWLQTQDRKTWELICAAVTDTVPSLGELIVEVNGNKLAIVARTAFGTRNLKQLGAGIEQLLLVAVASESQEAGRMVIVDEPEIGIHPTAQRTLLKHLRRWAENRQIVVVTHSPTMIEPSTEHPGERVYVVRQTNPGESTVEECDQTFWTALNELGVNPIDGFAATRVLFVEGPTEAKCFEHWFSDLHLQPWFRIIELAGCSKAGTSVQAIDGLDLYNSAHVLAILDADEGTRKPKDRVEILQRRELENYFLDQPAAILAVLKEDGGAPVDESEVTLQIEKAVDDLQTEVVRLRAQVKLDPVAENQNLLRLQGSNGSADGFKQKAKEALALIPTDERIDEVWEAVSGEVESQWAASKNSIVPGFKVLEAVWKHFNCAPKFDKLTTAPRIAKYMAEPPKEIVDIIERFVSGKNSALSSNSIG